MTKEEFLSEISTAEVDEQKVKKIQETYGISLPLQLQQLISCVDETVFFDDDSRILSFQEIIDAEEDLHTDFKTAGIIPVADCGDNDFVVFNSADNTWAKYNIIDEVSFKKRTNLCEVL